MAHLVLAFHLATVMDSRELLFGRPEAFRTSYRDLFALVITHTLFLSQLLAWSDGRCELGRLHTHAHTLSLAVARGVRRPM